MYQQLIFDCNESVYWLQYQLQCSNEWAQEAIEIIVHCLFESVKTDRACLIHDLPLHKPFTHEFFIEYLVEETQTVVSDETTSEQQYWLFHRLYQLLPYALLYHFMDWNCNEDLLFLHWNQSDLYICVQ